MLTTGMLPAQYWVRIRGRSETYVFACQSEQIFSADYGDIEFRNLQVWVMVRNNNKQLLSRSICFLRYGILVVHEHYTSIEGAC